MVADALVVAADVAHTDLGEQVVAHLHFAHGPLQRAFEQRGHVERGGEGACHGHYRAQLLGTALVVGHLHQGQGMYGG